jgi:hypothetical protein
MEHTMKRILASTMLLGLFSLNFVGCAEEAAKPAADTAAPATATPAGDAAKPAEDAAKPKAE